MATEFVVWSDFQFFKTAYELDFNDVNHNQKIVDFYTRKDRDGKTHLIICTNFQRDTGRPEYINKVVFLHGDNKQKFLDEMSPVTLVQHNQVVVEPKEIPWVDRVNFGKTDGLFKKPILWFPVTHKGSAKLRKTVIPNNGWLYDMSRDRVNLIIGGVPDAA